MGQPVQQLEGVRRRDIGSGRPVSATVTGDANQDGNNTNDRLPGVSRDSLVGPDYATTDMRLTRRYSALATA